MFYQCILLLLSISAISNCETRVAVAHLISETVNGSIYFMETDEGLHVTGSVAGLAAGKYGFHVHALGDTSTCYTTGAHFDPDGNTHGGRDHEVRHVGDLGNIVFVGTDSATASVDFVDNIISLRGRNSILGRALVLHAEEDDLGLGGDETSLTTGNAGARVACGVIGISSPSDPWNAAGSIIPSTRMTLLVIFIAFFCSFVH